MRRLINFLRFWHRPRPLTDWQRIFIQSKANGGYYDGDTLPTNKWEWPKK